MEKGLMQKVKLVGITKPQIEGLSSPGDLIAYCARVSNPSNQMNTLTAPKLLKYCVDHKHWSVFETVSATMEIETTRDIARQILRHRSFSFQEFSQRYADPTKDLNFVMREARLQDTKNRQNSIDFDDEELKGEWLIKQSQVATQAKLTYEWAISNGIAKEQARSVIPEGLIMSRLYMCGTIRSWIHYVQLRTEAGTQKEHREIALACAEAIGKIFPLINNFKN